MSEMVERCIVAMKRKMAETASDFGSSDEGFELLVRAVMTEMREPTEAMWTSDHPTWSLGRPMWDWWKQMIDEALK